MINDESGKMHNEIGTMCQFQHFKHLKQCIRSMNIIAVCIHCIQLNWSATPLHSMAIEYSWFDN